MPEIEALLAAYLGAQWGEPVAISGLKRFHGGSARETYRFDAEPRAGKRGLVLRRDPASSLIDTDRSIEFAALQGFHGTGVPVPEPLFLDPGTALGSPGFIMAEVPGVHAAGLLEPEPYAAAAAAVGETLFTALGAMHARVPDVLAAVLGAPENPASARLEHWVRAVEQHALGPEPIFWAGVRWLRRHLPPPPHKLSVVHGDFRSGNFLVDDANVIRAIVDWEMVHLGDAHEDLGWVMDPLWGHGSGRPAATLPESQALAVWEKASGMAVDPLRLRWWRVMAQVQGLAIWISSSDEIASGRSTDPAMIFASVYPYRFHNRTLAHALQELGA